MASAEPLALVADLPTDRGICVDVDGQRVGLFKVGRRVYAIESMCPHAGAFLHTGYLEGRVIRCPMHGWDFDVKTGKSPTVDGAEVKTFNVKVKKGAVYLV